MPSICIPSRCVDWQRGASAHYTRTTSALRNLSPSHRRCDNQGSMSHSTNHLQALTTNSRATRPPAATGTLRFDMDTISLDPDVPFYQHMDKYLSVKSICLSDYRTKHDVTQELKECSTYLTQVKTKQILDRADHHDPEAIIELAIRFISGCAMRKHSAEGALCSLDAFTDPERDPERSVIDIASPALMAQAQSCAAHAQYLKYIASPEERTDIEGEELLFCRPETRRLGIGQPPLTSLAFAAHHANESVKLGLTSHAALTVGLTLREVAESVGVDVTQMPEHAKQFRPLWRAVARRVDEIYEAERERLQKSSERTSLADSDGFGCAAEGCAVRRAQRAALRSCAGKCPADLKPGYCSRQCQKKDWARHRFVCKPGLTEKIPKVEPADKEVAVALFELGDSEDDSQSRTDVAQAESLEE
ncbi:hypothetical protein C8Q80DRAFT_327778 [Daedaleopsis nitida]|nr:hypothetical protein C8Q80DRAFT_327778 [Daedaleopsis nitida]